MLAMGFCTSFAFVSLLVVANLPQEPEPRSLPPLQAVQQAPLAEPLTAGIAVEVRSEKGRPVAGALVAVLPATWSPEQKVIADRLRVEHDGHANEHLAAELLQFGTRYRCNDQGRAFVPVGSRRLAACHGALAGELLLAADATDVVGIRLLGQRAVLVRVVGPDQKPVAGLPIDVGAMAMVMRPEAVTDAKGECVLGLRAGASNAKVVLVQPRLIGHAESRELTGAHPPRGPVCFTLPASGMLRVIVYDQGEQPRTDVLSVNVRVVGDHITAMPVAATVESSGAMCRVALGCQLDVSVNLRNQAGSLTAKCVGPTRAGELTICDVRSTQGPPVLAFVVLGIDGKPVAKERLAAVLLTEAFWRGVELLSDGEGRVRYAVPEGMQAGLELVLLRRGPYRRGSPTVYRGAVRVALPATMGPGENLLPDVHLVAEPVVIAGCVVDDEGKPIAGATVNARPGWQRPSHSWSGGSFDNVARSDAEGRFELRDLVTPGVIKLNVQPELPTHASVNVELATGTTDARVTLVRQGRLHVVLAEVKGDRDLLRAFLVPPGGVVESPDEGFPLRADTWLSAPAGRYDCVVRLMAGTQDLLRIADVTIGRGQDGEDARLSPLPWQQFVRPVTLTLVDAADKPVAGIRVVQWIDSGKSGRQTSGGESDGNGQFFTLVPKTGSRFVVAENSFGQPSRFRRMELTQVTDDQRLVLQPKLKVRVKLVGDMALPTALTVTWRTRSAKVQDRLGLLAMLPGLGGPAARNGVLDVSFDEVGDQVVEMCVVESSGGRPKQHVFEWGTIPVVEAASTQEFTLKLADDVATRLADLRERHKQ